MNRRALLVAGAAAVFVTPRRAWAQNEQTAYLLDLEAAQVALYTRARELPLKGRAAALAGRFHNHEVDHLARLRELLGGPEPQPATFSFGNEDKFLRAAQRLEALGVTAYNGAIPLIRDTGVRAELAAIAQTEARHASAIRELRGSDPIPRAYDPGADGDAVQQALNALRG